MTGFGGTWTDDDGSQRADRGPCTGRSNEDVSRVARLERASIGVIVRNWKRFSNVPREESPSQRSLRGGQEERDDT